MHITMDYTYQEYILRCGDLNPALAKSKRQDKAATSCLLMLCRHLDIPRKSPETAIEVNIFSSYKFQRDSIQMSTIELGEECIVVIQSRYSTVNFKWSYMSLIQTRYYPDYDALNENFIKKTDRNL